MSSSGGTDNPAFSNADEYTEPSGKLENSRTESDQQEEKDKSSHMSNGHSFVSQHYVESNQNSPQTQYKTETRIEVPTEGEKTPNVVKTNGINANGNNNDLSFLNSSITSGQITDGKKEQIEAVNLELVSMRPYTGNNLQTKGQEACEIPADPYEEYFVPVNEHRKYIRGEKLYVTKDKRSKSSYWRRIACWSFGLGVLSIALIIAILAATGVILTQEATQPLDNDHQRSLDDVNAAGSQKFIKHPPSSPSPETSTFPPWRTTDESTFKTVSNALEGSIWLDNLMWNDDLMDVKTRVYRDLTDEIENHLRQMIHNSEDNQSSSETIIKIYSVNRNGQVMFRISYPPVDHPDVIQENIEKALRRNGNMVGKYHLHRLNVKHLVDECQFNDMKCSEICNFDYINGIFACACLPGRIMDSSSANCIDESDLSDVNIPIEEEPRSAAEEMIQGRGRAPEQSFEAEHDDHWINHHHHHHQQHHEQHQDHHDNEFTEANANEPNVMNETDVKNTLMLNEGSKSEIESTSKALFQPGVTPEHTSESNVESEYDMESVAEIVPETERTVETGSSEATSSSEMNPIPSTESMPEEKPNLESIFEIKPNTEPKPEQEIPAVIEIEPDYEPKVISEPKLMEIPVVEPEAVEEMMPEPISAIGSDLDMKTSSEMTMVPESNTEMMVEPKLNTELMIEPKSNTEMMMEPKFDTEITIEPESSTEIMMDRNSLMQPTLQPKPEMESTIMPGLKTEMPPKSMSDDSIMTTQAEILPELESTSNPIKERTMEPEAEIPKLNMEEISVKETSETTPLMEHELTMPSQVEHIVEVKQVMYDTVEPKTEAEMTPESHTEMSKHSSVDSIIFDLETTMSSITEMKSTFEPMANADSSTKSATMPQLIMESNMSITAESNSAVMEQGMMHHQSMEPSPTSEQNLIRSEVDPKMTTLAVTQTSGNSKMESATENGSPMEPDSGDENIHIFARINSNVDLMTESYAKTMQPSNTESNPTMPTVISDIRDVTTEAVIEMSTKMSSEQTPTMLPMMESEDNSGMKMDHMPAIGSENDAEIKMEHSESPTVMHESQNKSAMDEESTTKSDSMTSEEAEQEMPTEMPKSNMNISKDLDLETFIKPIPSGVTEMPLMDVSMNKLNSSEETTEVTEMENMTMNPMTTIIDSDSMAESPKTVSPLPKTIPPELVPESIDPYMLIRDTFRTSTETIELKTEFPMQKITPILDDIKNSTETLPTTVEEKHSEDMSPFLPVIIREKETLKKAPRLDKDEQDFPNPFEPHVEDVIVHHQMTMTPPSDVNGNEFIDSANKQLHPSHDAHQTETSVRVSDSATTLPTTILTSSPLSTQMNAETTKGTQFHDEKLRVQSIEAVAENDSEMKPNVGMQLNDDNVFEKSERMKDNNLGQLQNRTENVEIIPRKGDELTTKEAMMSTESSMPTIKDENSNYKGKFDDDEDDNDDAVEDQYNDIVEERISKKIEVNDSDFRNANFIPEKISSKTLVKTTTAVPIMEDNISTTLMDDNQSTVSATITETTTDKIKDDNKLTTEIPIMPVEIQQDISTTEIPEKTESSVMINSTSTIIDSPQTIMSMSMLEAKTTAQIPILPEEFLTTEASTTDKMSVTNETETPTTSITETSTVSFEDIKPVSELILDDAEPDIFGHTHFFKAKQLNPIEPDSAEDISEDKLKIIPLEQSDDSEAVHSSIESTEVPSTIQTTVNLSNITPKIDKEDSIEIPAVPQLKIIEITSPNIDNVKHNVTIHPLIKSQSVPEVIPVHEEVEDDIEYPFTKHLNLLNNVQEIVKTSSNDYDNMTEMMTNNPKMSVNVSKTVENGTNMTKSDLSTSKIIPTLLENISTTPESVPTMSEDSTILAQGVPNIPDTPKLLTLPTSFAFSKCNAGQFQCINGTARDGAYCVSLSSKCDSENDCSDGSDELDCESEGCPGNYQCKSGQCLGRHLVCNGIADCDDNSDEDNCQNWECNFDEFKCPRGRCIPELWRCNGRPDCEDHRDEYSCAKSCGNDEYLCPTESWCVPQTWRCNGVPECANGEDEKLCDCGIEQFKCKAGGCISSSQVCDGFSHCPDHSDEWDCLVANMTMTTSGTDQDESENKKYMPVGQPIWLKIKQSDGNHHLVCADNWTKNHSDVYCQSLGYFGSEAFETAKYEEDEHKFLRLRGNFQETMSLLSNLEFSEVCESKQFVKTSCQEFSCGTLENEGPTARLIGGTPAGDGQLSSVVLLKEVKSGDACTASILGPLHALASYSCIYKYRQSNNWEIFTGHELRQSVKVKNIIPYPQVKYNQFMYNNDVALIELMNPLTLSRNLSAICLPSQRFQPRALCVTAGWGFPTTGEVNLKLKFLPVPIYNTEECNATSHYAGFITKNNICAGSTGTDKGTCYNDEGAPLICASETGQWELQGLLSYHSRCSRDHPAIYSGLSPIISWLQHTIPALQTRT